MKSKPVILSGLVVLILLLVVSILTIRQPQQSGTKAQLADSSQQCQSDGNSVTDQASCSGAGKQIVNYIVDAGAGGDSSSVQVCCKNITVVPPSPGPSCPGDTSETPENECPADRITLISSTADNGDGKYIRPGIVCCRPEGPTPTTSQNEPSLTPTPSACPLPDEPTINIDSVEVICPDGCSSATPQ